MIRRLQRLATGCIASVLVASSVSYGEHLFWAELSPAGFGRITRGNLDSTGVGEILNTGSAFHPSAVAIDQIAGKVYWTDGLAVGGAGSIRRANLNGTRVEVVIPGAGLSFGIAVDPINEKIYWTRPDGVYRANLDGSDSEPLIPPSGAGFGAYGVDVDLLNNKLYWTEARGGGSPAGIIRRSNLDGLNQETVVNQTFTAPIAVAVYPPGGMMYWVDNTLRGLRRANLDGTDVIDLFGPTGAEFPAGVAVDADNGVVYWSLVDVVDSIGRIRRCNLNGGQAGDYLSNVIDPKGIVVRTTPGIASSSPAYCAIDARQPHEISSASNVFGWSSVDLVFSELLKFDLEPWNFSVVEVGGTGSSPQVVGVMPLGPAGVRLTLSETIEPGAWTCIYNGGSGTKTCIGYLPADVNGDRTSGPTDILRLIDHLNGVVNPPYGLWQTDANRSGSAEPSDVLRVIDLLNGADAFDPWLGRTLPPCP
jgi:hypothetical protein